MRMECYSHPQRLLTSLLEHLVELVDNHIAELLRVRQAADHCAAVIYLLRIGNGQKWPGGRAQPEWLVVRTPIEYIEIACFLQQIQSDVCLRDPWAEPSCRCLAFMLPEDSSRLCDQNSLVRCRHRTLPLAVCASVASNFVTAIAKGREYGRSRRVDIRIDQQCDRKGKFFHELEQSPDTNPVTIVAPCVVQDIWSRP